MDDKLKLFILIIIFTLILLILIWFMYHPFAVDCTFLNGEQICNYCNRMGDCYVE